ncbi:phosphatidylinositol-specific phospholipase C/glycerophosphodiester phosphodiesterase family protein [Mucilaginibacter sp. BT774]|uniref:phosphatidylinositol-specific phospholipase C/glycerophosphodiester phosphodiesterase family protein n=1 Tax=Mucilaginibacter sp. BT774 TaxID=3062276 RepID=UPI0026763B26|nr:phosphatidylinositol-specific phospholipase C/glycerophosphodiester phosphodiesterase family protein [Mucilaginibacter sp. BT774]MDO3626939.1 phosphatidylinositol-specific phospholipase C/glycerophosphodiester phosphodiesterase family protein [Mucilaginibacter sp. BT774]
MKIILSGILLVLVTLTGLQGQVPARHSHNDYEQPFPFYTAYRYQFESIEEDIFLINGRLLVAHTEKELEPERTLGKLYLHPVDSILKKNNGLIYPGQNQKLQLLIDCKTEAYSTLKALIDLLKKYPAITSNANIKLVITGNRPIEEDYSKYPSYIFFDGRPDEHYSKAALRKIAIISVDFSQYSQWNGYSILTPQEQKKLQQVVAEAGRLNKPFRFWGCPDTVVAWEEFIKMGIAFINTDHIEQLSDFLKEKTLKTAQFQQQLPTAQAVK